MRNQKKTSNTMPNWFEGVSVDYAWYAYRHRRFIRALLKAVLSAYKSYKSQGARYHHIFGFRGLSEGFGGAL